MFQVIIRTVNDDVMNKYTTGKSYERVLVEERVGNNCGGIIIRV